MSDAGAAAPARVLAPFARRLLRVAGVEDLGAYRVLRVEDPDGPEPHAGQFAMLAAAEHWGGGDEQRPFVPRAFSVARRAGGQSHFLLEDVGPGTSRLCGLHAGEHVWALGPLGQGFTAPPEDSRPVLVGGGVGIAPLAILQDQLERADGIAAGQRRRGAEELSVLLGFRDRPRTPGAELLRGARIASDDGSAGHHGRVTDLLAAELDRHPQAVVYACGPAPMLEAVRALCAERSVAAQLALEAGMACGYGACYGCAVPTREHGYLRVCVDGPVIDAALLAHVDEHAGAPE